MTILRFTPAGDAGRFAVRRVARAAQAAALCASAACLPTLASAQAATDAAATAANATPAKSATSGSPASPASGTTTTAAATALDRVVVTGNPLGSRDTVAPVSVLEGDALVLRRGGSLGSTLDGLPGVSASAFGPNASRPVIRGLDGDRVRILNNAGGSLDASSLSFDHAVPLDPLVLQRVEVLRGPGALLYGGSAVGGVVNTIDNRIPAERLSGSSGALELRLGGADHERGASALAETGNDRYALHADLSARSTRDLAVPEFAPQPGVRTGRIANSASRGDSAAVGGTVFFDLGHLGASIDRYDNRYGIVAEPDVIIDMKRQHMGVAGELRAPVGSALLGFTKLTVNGNRTLYQHDEIEGTGALGTRFLTSGNEWRVEATQAPLAVLGGLRGVVGAQAEDSDFSALGDEAFVPSTRTRKRAVFAVEEVTWAGGTLSAGLRSEQVRVESLGDADPSQAQFGGPMTRRFSLRSVSLGNVARLSPQWRFTSSLSVSERAPTSFELFANGVHAATGAYERGDTTLAKERGRNLDLALQWQAGPSQVRVGTFVAQFSRFISLEATGATVAVPNDGGDVDNLPEFVFRSVRARLHGLELEAEHAVRWASWGVKLSGQIDLTRASNLDTGEALPRIAPARLRLGVTATQGPWTAGVGLLAAARQDRVPATDTPTAGHGLVNLSVSRQLAWGGTQGALWFLRVDNVFDQLAYNAAAVQTIRGLAPVAGRSLKTGVRLTF